MHECYAMTKNVMLTVGTYVEMDDDNPEDFQVLDTIDKYQFLTNEEERHMFNDDIVHIAPLAPHTKIPSFVQHQQKKRNVYLPNDDVFSIPSNKKMKEAIVVSNGSYKSEISDVDSDSQKIDSFVDVPFDSRSKSSTTDSRLTSMSAIPADYALHAVLQKKYSIQRANGTPTIQSFAFSDMDRVNQEFSKFPDSILIRFSFILFHIFNLISYFIYLI